MSSSLFEIDHMVTYGVHVYRAATTGPEFRMATSLYHPETVNARCVTTARGKSQD